MSESNMEEERQSKFSGEHHTNNFNLNLTSMHFSIRRGGGQNKTTHSFD